MPPSLPDYPFRQAAHDRLAERRSDEDFLAASWSDPHSRVLIVDGDRLAANSAGNSLRFVGPADAPAGERMLLGSVDGTVHFLLVAARAESAAVHRRDHETQLKGSCTQRPEQRFMGLRQLAMELDDVQASLAVHAMALASWHQRHRSCAMCGEATEVAEAGAQRRCTACATAHFPRTDPAVIMLVTDVDDRCLLGHNAARSAGWFSTLAGFVEPGETPEQAVIREVHEEAGVVVSQPTYAGSQPWPFPSSLMLGYFATASTTELAVDGEEITEARWFSRQGLLASVQSGQVGLPTTLSIAGALLTAWYGAPLPPNALDV